VRGAATVLPVGTDEPAGAKIARLSPFGPLTGTAANCCLLGHDHKSFVGINADAAAVPDLDTLADIS
jgi:diacylglycerol O-acyltransferase